jgi:hypothetical protein
MEEFNYKQVNTFMMDKWIDQYKCQVCDVFDVDYPIWKVSYDTGIKHICKSCQTKISRNDKLTNLLDDDRN